MTSLNLEKLRECCSNPKYFLIIYDGADTPYLPILVCDQCVGESAFQKFIVARYQLTEKTDVKKILEDFQVV